MGKWKFIIILLVLGLAVYFNSLFNGFIWDDEEQVVNNSYVHSLSNLPILFLGSTFNSGGAGLAGLYYKPILSFSYLISYSLFGNHAAGFHLIQLLIHLTNAALIYLFLSIFLKKWTSFVISLIFAIHPINAEAVAYIAALQEPLFFLFGILSLYYFVRHQANFKSILICSMLLLLSLLSKETGGLFLVMVPLGYWLIQKPKLQLSKFHSLFFLLPSLISLTGYLVMRLGVANIGFSNMGPSPIMRTPFLGRLINIPEIIFFYLKGFFLPIKLAIAQHWVILNIDFEHFYLPLMIDFIFLVGFIIIGLFLKQIGQKQFRIYLFFLIWFLIGIGFHLQLIALDMTTAERWFYFPLVGLLGILGIFMQNLTYPNGKKSDYLVVFLIIIIMLLATRTFMRNFNWRDGLTLYTKDIVISENSFDLQNNLGVEQYRSGITSEAATHFQKSVQLAPHWWTNWNNLGVIYEQKQDYKSAADSYQKAIDNGNYYLAYENLARLMITHESTAAAVQFTTNALTILPRNSKLWLYKAIASYQTGDKANALIAATNAYNLSGSPESYYIYTKISRDQPLELKMP